ncbi:hypothetical protein K461DRAFT_255800 [Myriangium duriaei CBS 260.36]|uniref:Uncharacterized protein n=1 Tax=Myriangium duriaei CBS 260.36 TaxID=1168546 RepID=A0A9P4J131_9PEZI|nr:hypothetical protein K461DRAFT_255800 [Myriangium duriaei CBS 260.36]
MSINWVMLPPASSSSSTSFPPDRQPFTPLPSETTLYTSPPRTSFSIASLGKFPAQQPFSLSSSSGRLYLTTKRIIYLPATPTPTLQSFASPLLNLQDSHVSAPWIGPNVWSAIVRPVQGGHLEQWAGLEVKITFRDGGAYDFQGKYERVRERLGQAVEAARARGVDVGGRQEGVEYGTGRGGGVMGVEVVMEDLPRYEDAGNSRRVEGDGGMRATGGEVGQQGGREGEGREESTEESDREVFTPPDEPPPGYEQVQREVIEDEFTRRLTATRLDREHEDTPSR